jgi:hypothetical protein
MRLFKEKNPRAFQEIGIRKGKVEAVPSHRFDE